MWKSLHTHFFPQRRELWLLGSLWSPDGLLSRSRTVLALALYNNFSFGPFNFFKSLNQRPFLQLFYAVTILGFFLEHFLHFFLCVSFADHIVTYQTCAKHVSLGKCDRWQTAKSHSTNRPDWNPPHQTAGLASSCVSRQGSDHNTFLSLSRHKSTVYTLIMTKKKEKRENHQAEWSQRKESLAWRQMPATIVVTCASQAVLAVYHWGRLRSDGLNNCRLLHLPLDKCSSIASGGTLTPEPTRDCFDPGEAGHFQLS